IEQAVGALQKAVEREPGNAAMRSELGAALTHGGWLEQGIEQLHKSLVLNAASADAWTNLARALMDQGQIEEAASAIRRALQLRPDEARWSTLLLLLNYHPDYDAEAIAREQR